MRRVALKEFLLADSRVAIVDVRSPAEFAKGHIPGAINIPLFSDDERAKVGTTYTQIGREQAIDVGLQVAGPKISALAKKARAVATQGRLKLHCWRGGMRSEKMAWLFELVGLEVTVLEGGYKAFRQHLQQDFSNLQHLIVLHGPTGSGKTAILHALSKMGEQIIDLEDRANHRGSAFGAMGMAQQPTTAQFQNLLYGDLIQLDQHKRIWVESESLSIGKVYLPESLWKTMNRSTIISLKMGEHLRAGRIVREYGGFAKADLAEAIEKIRSRFGGNGVEKALKLLEEDQPEAVALLLLKYYDKAYAFSKNKYKKKELTMYEAKTDDPKIIANDLVSIANRYQL
jgi:tRNA 2-selenouridine synthase